MKSFSLVLLYCALVGHGNRLKMQNGSHEILSLRGFLFQFSPSAARVATSSGAHRMRPIELQQPRKSERRALPAAIQSDDILFRKMGSDLRLTRQEAIAGLASLIAVMFPRRALAAYYAEFKKSILTDATELKPQIVLILRVREACKQEIRLITSAKYKDLQRADISLAIKFIIENYSMKKRFATAAALALTDKAQQQEAFELGTQAIEFLVNIQAYTGDPKRLKVTEVSGDKKDFVLKCLDEAIVYIDKFLEKMPADVVAAANQQVEEENQLNIKEYPKDEQILNLDPKYYKDGAVPVSLR